MSILESVIYQLKVVLQGISPMIWRRLLLCGDRTIADGEWYPIIDPGDEKLPLIAQLPRFFPLSFLAATPHQCGIRIFLGLASN
jgi:hypothetical protein